MDAEGLYGIDELWRQRRATLAEHGRVLAADDPLLRAAVASDHVYEVLLKTDPDDPFAPLTLGSLEFRLAALAVDGAPLPTVLRNLRQQFTARLAAAEVAMEIDIEDALRSLSAVADRILDQALRAVVDELTELHGVPRDRHGAPMGLGVLGMGKLGGNELNFSSDVDLVFVFAEHGHTDGRRSLEHEVYFARMIQRLVKLVAEPTADGFAYRIDTRLRPFGDAGRPVLSVAASLQYYESEGRDWERYAWIKARPVAGDVACAQQLLDGVAPFVYRRYLDLGALEGLRSLRELIDREVERKDMLDDLKRGPGGIREIEFQAQLEQLLRGGRFPQLRTRKTLQALECAAGLGLIDRQRQQELRHAYRFLRRVENAVQARADQQTHRLPDGARERAQVALYLGYANVATLEADIAEVMACVAAHSASAFGRGPAQPVVEAGFDGALEADLASLNAQASAARVPERARRALARLLPQVAELKQLPVATVQALFVLFGDLLLRSTYLELLAERPAILERLGELLTLSPRLAQDLRSFPYLLDEVLDPRLFGEAFNPAMVEAELGNQFSGDLEHDADALRRTKRSFMLKIEVDYLDGRIDEDAVGAQLAALAEVLLRDALALALDQVSSSHGWPPGSHARSPGLVLIGLGAFGAQEMRFGSDLDLIALTIGHDPQSMTAGARPIAASEFYRRAIQRLITLLTARSTLGELYTVDFRLRPNGEAGPLATPLAAYERYLRSEAWTFELQALTRARAVAGCPTLGQSFAAMRRAVLGSVRDPNKVDADLAEMRERLAQHQRGHKSAALIAIEFEAQGLVLKHAATTPALLDGQSTLSQLAIAVEHGLLDRGRAEQLVADYKAERRARIRAQLAG